MVSEYQNQCLVLVGILACLLVTISAPEVVAKEGSTVEYDEAKPFLELMADAVEDANSPEVNVAKHSKNIGDYDPSSLSSLTNFVTGVAEQADQESNGKIVDRTYRIVNDKLSLCLGTKHGGDSSVATTIFCQNVDTNLLSKLVVKNSSDEVLGKYILK